MDRRAARELLTRLERDARRICARFDLRYRVLEAERANVKARYGICYSDGTIKIRLRHATTGQPLKYSSLVSTLCHELAHLRHFNHGPRFQDFYARLLAWSRREGIYRPGPEHRLATGKDMPGRLPATAWLPLAPSAQAPAPPAPPGPPATTGPQQLDLFS
ncbi:MAG: M48 family metallopeptidase [Deltaproteobacteria bacterium]|nr:M48 family metallopeptidase [Deltaproteobacteria bacterium]MBW2417801.1 M48 family metallopeptidase [Deltaproteobacteria bacterium]